MPQGKLKCNFPLLGGAPNWGTQEVESMTDRIANVNLDGRGVLFSHDLLIHQVFRTLANYPNSRLQQSMDIWAD